ncbi:mitochondrial proton/calcium exchanger protein-like protein isoform X1 [Tanacetum coccineum]
MVDLIFVPGVDSHQLRIKVFPLSLADDAKEWWISEGDEKITTWEELVKKFFCRFYPKSYDREDEMLDEGENWGIDPLEFLSNINTSFKYHKKVDGRTQKVIFHAWINGNWNKRYVDNCISSSNELKESKYENPPNTAFDSFFKAYEARDIEKQRYYQRNNTNPSFQERRQSIEDTLSKFMSESEKRHEENSNLIKEIRALTNAAIRNQGSSIKTLEIEIRQMSKVLQERGFRILPSSTKTNSRDQVNSILTTIKDDSNSIRHIGSNQYVVSTRQNNTLLYKSRQMTVPFPSRLDNHYCEEEGNYGPKFTEAYGASHINNAIPQKEKDPGSFTLPCFINDLCFDNALVDLGASVSVMPLSTYLNLGLVELAHTRLTVELADRTVKYPKGIAETY